MERRIVITESQYRYLLGENLHYPRFLKSLNNELSTFVRNKINGMLVNGITDKKYFFKSKNINEYFDSIEININLYNGECNNIKNYVAEYYNGERLVDNKLTDASITFKLPIKGELNLTWLDYAVNHEIIHLYDDWVGLKNGNEPLSLQKRFKIGNDIKYYYNQPLIGEIFKYLSNIVYLKNKCEMKSFVGQTYQELKSIGCTLDNFREKVKETISYNNYKKAVEQFRIELSKMDEFELEEFNEIVFNRFKGVNIPILNPSSFDDNLLRTKLNRWVERCYHDFMVRYGGIVQCYLDDLLTEESKKTERFFVI